MSLSSKTNLTELSRATEMDESVKDPSQEQTSSVMGDLLTWNGLTYKMPVTNSVTVARNLKTFPAQTQEYKNSSTAYITIQSGQQFIDWQNSWLQFELDVSVAEATTHNTPSYLTWGVGSVCNLIERVVVTSRSGVELARIDDFARYRIMKDRMTRQDEWFETVGNALGYTDNHLEPPFFQPSVWSFEQTADGKEIKHLKANPLPRAVDYSAKTGLKLPAPEIFHKGAYRKSQIGFGNPQNAAKLESHKFGQFAIPMSLLGGFFDTGKLCPAMLCAGLKIELKFNDPVKAFTQFTSHGLPQATTTSFIPAVAIKNLEIVCDAHTLNDAAMREITRTSAQNGLEYVYTGVHNQSGPTSSANLNLQITKAVSRAVTCFGSLFPTFTAASRPETRVVDHNSTTFAAVDPTTARIPVQIPVVLTRQQWRLGSQYYPHQPFIASADNANDAMLPQYMNMLYAADRMDGDINLQYSSPTVKQVIVKSIPQVNAGAPYVVRDQVSLEWVNKGFELYETNPTTVTDEGTYQWGAAQVAKPKISFSNGMAIAVATFERSNLLRYSGVPINNARTLNVDISTNYTEGTERPANIQNPDNYQLTPSTYVFFLEHVVLAKAFLNNVVVSI